MGSETSCSKLQGSGLHTTSHAQYSIDEYRNKLYLEIVRRKKELRRRQRGCDDARDVPSRARAASRASVAHRDSARGQYQY